MVEVQDDNSESQFKHWSLTTYRYTRDLNKMRLTF